MLDPTLRQMTLSIAEYEQALQELVKQHQTLQAEFDAYKEMHPPAEEGKQDADTQTGIANPAGEARVSDVLPEGMTDAEVIPLDHGPVSAKRTPWAWEQRA